MLVFGGIYGHKRDLLSIEGKRKRNLLGYLGLRAWGVGILENQLENHTENSIEHGSISGLGFGGLGLAWQVRDAWQVGQKFRERRILGGSWDLVTIYNLGL